MAQKRKKRVGGQSKNRRVVEANYHHGDLKNALLESAVDLLRKHGPQAFSLRELALSVGVSSAAPYRHFKTKEKLFSALAVRGFSILTAGFIGAIQNHPDNPIEQLHNVGLSYYEFARQYPEHLQMMFGNIIPQTEIAKDVEFGAAAGQAFGALVQVVKSCQKKNFFKTSDDSKMLAILMWSSIHGFAALDSAGTLKGASGLDYDPGVLVVQISKIMTAGLLAQGVV